MSGQLKVVRALSLHQPYASLIASGRKTLETRKWRTHHRGTLLICAAKTKRPDIKPISQALEMLNPVFPLGVALCLVDVVACRPMTTEDEDAACCPIYPGAWAWELTNLRPVTPFPVKGQQGFFSVEMPL